MKRQLFTCILLCLTVHVFAQKRSFLGYEVGLGVSQMHSQNITSNDATARRSFTFGLRYQKPINKHLNLLVGPNLLFNGDKFSNFTVETESTKGDFEKLNYRLGYLQIPVLAQFHTKKKILRFYGAGGISGGVMLFNHAVVPKHTPCFIYTDSEFRRLEFGLTGSAGVEIQYRFRGRFYAEVRGNLGLSDAIKTGPISFHNRSTLVVFGVSSKLRKKKDSPFTPRFTSRGGYYLQND